MKMLIVIMMLVFIQTAHANECFDSNRVRGWNYDNATRIVTLRAFRDAYEVKTFFNCSELKWARQIAFRSFSSFRTCRGDEILALDAWGKIMQICRIDSVKKVSL